MNGSTIYPDAGGEFSGLGQGINKFLDYLMSSELQSELFLLKIVFIVISAIFLFFVVYFMAKSDYLDWKAISPIKTFFSPQATKKKKIVQRWEKVKNDLEKAEVDAQWKLALVEGLGIFNNGLSRAGYAGANLQEQVDKIKNEELSNLQEVKEVVPVCQNIIQDPECYINKKRVEQIIRIFEKTLKELEIL